MSSGRHNKTSTEARSALLPRTPSSASRNEMQKPGERPLSAYDVDYSDKFRKFSEAVIDTEDNFDSIELDLNRNSSVNSKNGASKAATKAAQVNICVA